MDLEKKTMTKILFDTDIGGDCDDAGALAMLHRLCDLGECELLAVTACYASPYVAGCIDAINRGVRKVFIMDGRVPHSILIESLTDEGAGTMVIREKK